MMPNEEIIANLLSNPQAPVDLGWVKEMLEAHPSFILPALLFLKRNPEAADEETLQKLRTVVALNCPDRTALADYVDITDAGWANFYPEVPTEEPTTEQTIDDFISNYGLSTSPEEEALLEKLIFSPAPADYFAGTDEPYDPNDPLALPPELRRDSDDEAEEAQMAEEPETETEKEEIPAQNAQKGADESLLMESLAKIFIKQRRYGRAYEIISKLSLNYPEKSVYFADQMRFLQILMINQQHLDK